MTDDVIQNRARWSCEVADAVEWLRGLPDDSVDLLFTSPPYELARTYGIGERMVGGQEWVDWMVQVVRTAAPKVKGLIAINCEGQTRDYAYSGVPFLLFADLHRAGFNMRKPPIFRRVGIPGSGGPDWLRNDYEPIICVTRAGQLPWSDNAACGHPPKWAPGGEMSNRDKDGVRKNKKAPTWLREGMHTGVQNDIKLPKPKKNAFGVQTDRAVGTRPSGDKGKVCVETYRAKFRHAEDGTVKGSHDRDICAVVNPGNVLSLNVGGGVMGHPLAHDNEAPFPLDLPAFFVKSFCPPDGIVCDPFSGSGTTCHAAFENGRRFVGCDIRESQVELCARRLATVTPSMF